MKYLETPGYAVVEAGNTTDVINLLKTSGPCLVILLAHLMCRSRSKARLASALTDPSSKCRPGYLLIAANPVTMFAMQEPSPPPSVITVMEQAELAEDCYEDVLHQLEALMNMDASASGKRP